MNHWTWIISGEVRKTSPQTLGIGNRELSLGFPEKTSPIIQFPVSNSPMTNVWCVGGKLVFGSTRGWAILPRFSPVLQCQPGCLYLATNRP